MGENSTVWRVGGSHGVEGVDGVSFRDVKSSIMKRSDLRTRDPSLGCSEANCELARAILKVRPKGRAEG